MVSSIYFVEMLTYQQGKRIMLTNQQTGGTWNAGKI